MVERIEPVSLAGQDIEWEPNAPDACLLADDRGRVALAQRAHPDDPDQRCVVLRWDLPIHVQMGRPNDEGRHLHRLYDKGLRGLLWLGVVRDSELVEMLRPRWTQVGDGTKLEPMHFVVPSKEVVVEILSADVDVFRMEGSTHEAAARTFGPQQ